MKYINKVMRHKINCLQKQCFFLLVLLCMVPVSQAAVELNFIQSDHLGTPRVLSDNSGDTVWRLRQTPFGETTIEEDPDGDGNAVVANLRFPGQYFDGETGLHYNYFRYYDPKIGRYITSDPIGLLAGPNTYAYVGGNPIVRYDPDGKFWLQIAGGVIGGGINAYNHYQAYQSGQITGAQYAQLIAVGSLTGVLSTFGGGIVGNALLGGVTAAANNGISQLVANNGCTTINTSSIVTSATVGIFAGGITGGATQGLVSVSQGAGYIPSLLQTPIIGGALNATGNTPGIIGAVGFTAGTAISLTGN